MARATHTPRAVLVGAALGVVVLSFVIKQFSQRGTEHSDAPEQSAAQLRASDNPSHDWSALKGTDSGAGVGAAASHRPSRLAGTNDSGAPQAGEARRDKPPSMVQRIVEPGTATDEIQDADGAMRNTDTAGSGAPAGADRAVPAPKTGADVPQSGAEPDHRPQEDSAQAAPPEVAQASSLVEQGAAYFSGDEQRFSTETQFQIPNSEKIVGQAGSFAVVLQPGWNQDSQDDASFFELGETGPHLFKNVNFLRFQFLDANDQEIGTGTNIGAWSPDERHVLTATWGGGRLALYVDGQLAGQQVYSGELNLKDGTPALVGSNFPEGRPVAPGVLSDVQLYSFPLAAADVASLAKKLNAAPRASH